MVILGAGASYDSVPEYPPPPATRAFGRERFESRPPLANELFLNTGLFKRSIDRFPDCHHIVPYLRDLPEDESVEQALEKLQAEAPRDSERYRQLAAIQYYLQFVIYECVNQWRGDAGPITNYKTLLDQLRRSRQHGEPVCVVTFNYDCMIEDALATVGVPINEIEGYIANDKFKIFKLHGSTNWAREVDAKTDLIGPRDQWQVGEEIRRQIGVVEISGRYRIVEGQTPISQIDRIPLFPAIAVPFETGKSFECPQDHLDCLKAILPDTRKALVIGWRGAEQHFLQLLKESFVNKIVPTLAVAESKAAADSTFEQFRRAKIPVTPEFASNGFSEFIVSRQAEKFLSC